jgi:hypothetical protein
LYSGITERREAVKLDELSEKTKRKYAKRYLQQIEKLEDEIELREEGLKELKAVLEYKARGMQERVQTSVTVDGLCRNVIKLLVDEAEYEECVDKLKTLRGQIIKEIYTLPEPKHCKILAIIYIKMIKDFWKAAEIINYSYSHVRRLHRKALVSFYDNVLKQKEEGKRP